MTQKPPAFQFYADDFLAGTMKFSDAEVGLYIRLLCAQWSEGGLPYENHMLSTYGRGDTPVERVKAKFKQCEDGLLRNERLEFEREKQRKYRESRSLNGKSGGRPEKPHAKHMVSQTKAYTKAQESSPSPSPSPIYTHTLAEVPTLTEVKAYASLHGIKPESAQAFYDHHEGNQLWVNQHGKLINWQHKLAAWAAKDRAMPSKSPQDASKPVGGTTEAIIRQRELDDVTKQIASIRARDEHMSYSEAEKAKLKHLKARQAELKAALGWKLNQ